MKRIVILTLALVFLPTLTAYDVSVVQGQNSQKPVNKNAPVYVCPMHPEVTRSKRGKCHKCGMALRLKKKEDGKNTNSNSNESSGEEQAGSVSVRRIPDVPVFDQNGRQLNFHKDLIANKVVAVNFVFTTCTTACPPLTATFRKVQQELGEEVGKNVWLISVSVDPATDTPERLREFAEKFKAGPGWTFVTGDASDIGEILRGFGVGITNKTDHTPMILIGNETKGVWTRAYGLSSPVELAKLIIEVSKSK
jgi:cytochrome oxidase Cu insertion factor (SCO1/SenC/PrrC family)